MIVWIEWDKPPASSFPISQSSLVTKFWGGGHGSMTTEFLLEDMSLGR